MLLLWHSLFIINKIENMKKAIIILILAFLVCSGRLFAAPRTPQQALEVARTFVRSHVNMKHIDTKELRLTNGQNIVDSSSFQGMIVHGKY